MYVSQSTMIFNMMWIQGYRLLRHGQYTWLIGALVGCSYLAVLFVIYNDEGCR